MFCFFRTVGPPVASPPPRFIFDGFDARRERPARNLTHPDRKSRNTLEADTQKHQTVNANCRWSIHKNKSRRSGPCISLQGITFTSVSSRLVCICSGGSHLYSGDHIYIYIYIYIYRARHSTQTKDRHAGVVYIHTFC